MGELVRLPERTAEVIAEADVVVCGGGPAGLAAALAAARAGARVCLLERYGFLGGNFTAAAVGTVCGLYVPTGAGFDYAVGGIAREVADALIQAGAAHGPIPFKETAVLLYVPWAAKRLADRLVTAEERIRLLLHAQVIDVVLGEDGRLRGVVVASKQGPKVVRGAVVVDCTGDADVAVAAGVPWEMGGPRGRQFASMQFFMQHVDVQTAMTAGLGALAGAIAEHGAHLTRDSGAVLPTFRPGEMIGAMVRVSREGRPIDGTDLDDLTYGELEGRRRAEEAAAFLREHMPGFAESFLQDTPPQLGIRETRHIRGRYLLTGDDVRSLARFPDAIACCAWPQEYHTRGRGTEYVFLPQGATYQIPYRSLVPGEQRGLLVAGRCISADHEALASCRVMAPSMAMGQAAGLAAAMAAASGDDPSELKGSAVRDAVVAAGGVLG